MSAISETYKNVHNILELFDTLTNFSFAASEMQREVSNKIGIYKLFNKVSHDLRLFQENLKTRFNYSLLLSLPLKTIKKIVKARD